MHCSQVSERPATSNGGLHTDRYPGGTDGEEPEDEDIGNPDIRIPEVQNAECPRRPEEEDNKNVEVEKGRGERDSEETQRPGQRAPGGNPDDGQGGPETRRLCHVPGGAWLQQNIKKRTILTVTPPLISTLTFLTQAVCV
ncbi:hypothetical protein NDU88_003957 [Pleurodeles waltl]|uniref:Uncharacterized protein n=1 Tax=Pleurodeles waltl TaxID=8319 RepID=A0AAV7UHT2_PLEWA|nr:hypothetical protein NDU88_003957 [Pleurodeles waltl]